MIGIKLDIDDDGNVSIDTNRHQDQNQINSDGLQVTESGQVILFDNNGMDIGDICIHGQRCSLCIRLSYKNDDDFTGVFCCHMDLDQTSPDSMNSTNVFNLEKCPDKLWYKDKPCKPEMEIKPIMDTEL